MDNFKVVFTDSGLGGLSIMADFVKLTEIHNLNVDSIFFNAQHSRDWGYKKMDSETQVKVFDRALQSMQNLYNPDIIAIACNTLSVVYAQSMFKIKPNTIVLDIIETGKSLIHSSVSETIIELAMPTTIKSGIYNADNKEMFSFSTDPGLPDAIENGQQENIDNILNRALTQVRSSMVKHKLLEKEHSLFLGCTHFPAIKDQFIEIAEQLGIGISSLLDPNEKFSQLIFDESLKKIKKSANGGSNKKVKNLIKVVSRLKLKEEEINNYANLIEIRSPETVHALKNYEYNESLF